MRALVTGATGKVGNAIASTLLERGDHVRALVRDPKRAASVLPAAIEPVEGDVTDPDTLASAVEGCELVFNSMGLPEQWVRDEAIFDRVNAVGSGRLASAAKRAGVRRFIHTSTHDVFGASRGERFDEKMLADYPKGTAYERSKQRAEQLVLAERGGMEVVILNPSAVYGPGPAASVSFDKELFEPLIRKPLPPRRRLRRLQGARRDRRSRRGPRARPAAHARPGGPRSLGAHRGHLEADATAPARAARPAALLPLAGPSGLIQGAARARLADDAAGGGHREDAGRDRAARTGLARS